MLERNRGARRDRTRRLIRRRSEWRVREEIHTIERDLWGWPVPLDGNGKRMRVRGYVPGCEPTTAQVRAILRYCRRHEGRVSLMDDACGDCNGHGPCDWCYAGTQRKQYQLHCRLNDDMAEWERDFYGVRSVSTPE